VRKARRARVVEHARLWRALAEAQNAWAVDEHRIGTREPPHESDDLRAVDSLDRRAVREIADRAPVSDEREAGIIERRCTGACVHDVHLDERGFEDIAAVIVGVVAWPRNRTPRVGNHRARVHGSASAS